MLFLTMAILERLTLQKCMFDVCVCVYVLFDICVGIVFIDLTGDRVHEKNFEMFVCF